MLTAPLTTALMVASWSDATVEARLATDSDEERALDFAKAIARRVVTEREGVGYADGAPAPITPEGVDALLEVWPIFEAFQAAYVAKGLLLYRKKRLRGLADWHFGEGDRYCAACGQSAAGRSAPNSRASARPGSAASAGSLARWKRPTPDLPPSRAA